MPNVRLDGPNKWLKVLMTIIRRRALEELIEQIDAFRDSLDLPEPEY
jgi:hypothetical protein